MNRIAITKQLAGAISASLLAKLADDVQSGELAEKLRKYKLEAEATGARGVELDVLVHRRLLEDWALEIAHLANSADDLKVGDAVDVTFGPDGPQIRKRVAS